MTILTQERERLAQQVQSIDGDPMKYADWSFKLRSYFGAVDQRYQEELMKTESSSTPRLNADLGSEESALSTQMYYILVMTTAGAALDKCHNAGVNEGFEAWRQFVMEWEPKLRTRYVGLLMNVLGYTFRDDIPTKLAAFERLVHDNENQSTKTVDDDIKIGVTMLDGGHASERAPHPEQRQNHKLEPDVRGDSRDHENTTVHRQSTTANAARSESKEQKQRQREQRQRQRHQGQRQGNECEKRIVQESEKRRSEKVLLLQQNRPREGRVQTETERPCRGRRETGGSVATSTRRNSDRAVTVPLPGEGHSSTFVIAVPCVNSKTSCENYSEQTVRSPGAVTPPRQKHNERFQEVLTKMLQMTRRWHQWDSRQRQMIR